MNIESLSIMVSCGCNLSCSYCNIAKSVNNNSNDIQKKTIEALKNGTFLQNTKRVLYKLNQSQSSIKSLALWGQEPTLTLHYLTEHLDEWCETFPNIQFVTFVTNGAAFPERIINFIKTLDKNIKQKSKFQLQFSYDGEYSNTKYRGVSSETIQNNIKRILSELNNYSFKNLSCTFTVHGVLSQELVRLLNKDNEALLEYNKFLNEWPLSLIKLNNNKNIDIVGYVDLGVELPQQASSYDGIEFNSFLRKSLKINPKIYQSFSAFLGVDSIIGLLYPFFNTLSIIAPNESLDSFIQRIIASENIEQSLNKVFNSLLYCGSNTKELKLLYDGTLINCQNHIYEKDVEFLLDDSTIQSGVKKDLATHHYFCNPLKDSENVVSNMLSLFETTNEHSFISIWHSTMALMAWLRSAKQIDESYEDDFKLIKHSFLLTLMNCCPYNQWMETGSSMLKSTSYIRLWANGALDLAERGVRHDF